jgi:tetratricopeptide (TPR) repeat protein
MTLLLLFLHAVCPLLFFTDLTRNPYVTQIYLLEAGLLAALLLRVAAGFKAGRFVFRKTLLDGPVLIAAAVAPLSWVVSWGAHPALRPSVFHEGLRAHLFLGANLLLPFFLSAQVRDPSWRARFQRTALAVGAVAAGYGVLQYFGVEWFWSKALNPYNGRPVSTFGNPNFLSSYLVMLLPLGLWEFLRSRGGGRATWGAVLLLYGAALVCTMTRSSWIGALAAGGVFLAAERPSGRKDARDLLVLGAFLAAMVFLWPGSPLAEGVRQDPLHRASELFRGVTGSGVYGSWHQRLLIWSCGRDMFLERPLFGKGWGCFELFFPFYQGAYLHDAVFGLFRTHANNAHNVLVEVASQTGAAGLGAAAWVLLTAALLLVRRGSALPAEARGLAWARAAAVTGMLADNFFGNVSLFFAVPAFFFAWTAGALATDVADDGERAASSRKAGLAVLAGALALASLGGATLLYRAWRGELDYFEGYKRAHRDDLAGAIRSLESSRAWRRFEVNNAYELANCYVQQARRGLDQGLGGEGVRDLFAASVAAFDDALAANAGYDEIHFNRATALLPLGRREEAVLSLRTSLLINPLHEETFRVLGDLYARGPADAERQADLFRRATAYFPRQKDFWNGLGHALARMGKPAEAVEPLSRALALDVDFKTAESNLRSCLAQTRLPAPPILAAPGLAAEVRAAARLSRWPEARAKAEALAVLAPECPLAWLMTADLRARTGDSAGALAAYDRVLALDPAQAAALSNKAVLLKSLGETAR